MTSTRRRHRQAQWPGGSIVEEAAPVLGLRVVVEETPAGVAREQAGHEAGGLALEGLLALPLLLTAPLLFDAAALRLLALAQLLLLALPGHLLGALPALLLDAGPLGGHLLRGDGGVLEDRARPRPCGRGGAAGGDAVFPRRRHEAAAPRALRRRRELLEARLQVLLRGRQTPHLLIEAQQQAAHLAEQLLLALGRLRQHAQVLVGVALGAATCAPSCSGASGIGGSVATVWSWDKNWPKGSSSCASAMAVGSAACCDRRAGLLSRSG
eukprot:CAMPEP_0176269872 /NCGR_PEP_ID=MMETSP0121_2-20121125/44409_1 /TAXON_ID=160619 /ORGANISM="Kryptoperidinium foliaceum, Strain CCMP 1326" /LENGTH=267 /DNA_ID=CAMNT_0017610001 /DNA_START=58 /DNA_END=859 /DNA_ORIENTATION=+